MTASTKQQGLTLSREEQWVVHHVMLDRIELETEASTDTDPPPLSVYHIFEKVDSGIFQFSQRERQCLENELSQYAEAGDTPDRDKSTTDQILTKLQRTSPSISGAESLL